MYLVTGVVLFACLRITYAEQRACPIDWTKTDTACYYILGPAILMNYTMAKEICSHPTVDGQLPWFNNEKEYSDFAKFTKTNKDLLIMGWGGRSWVMLGITDELEEGKWGKTMSNGTFCPAKVFHWHSWTEPNHGGTPTSVENCAAHNADGRDQNWYDFSCEHRQNVICQRPFNDYYSDPESGTSTTAIAIGVSATILILIIIVAVPLAVFIRRRRWNKPVHLINRSVTPLE